MWRKLFEIFVCIVVLTTSFVPLVRSFDTGNETIDEIIITSNKIVLDEECGCESNDESITINFERLHYYKPSNHYDSGLKPTILESLPEYFSWRDYDGKDWTTSAKNQLWPYPCGSCWAFAVVAAIESIINIREYNPDLDLDLSEQYLLSCLSKAGSCKGGWPESAFRYILLNNSYGNYCNGIILEECFPYKAIDTNGNTGPTSGYNPILCEYKCPNWKEYLIPIADYGTWYPSGSSEDVMAMKSQIMSSGPIIALIMYTYYPHGEDSLDEWGWEHQNPDEYYTTTDEYDYSNHAVLIVGWNDDASIKNGGYWICKNSMGEEWGYDGFFNIEYGCLNIDSHEIDWVEYDPDAITEWTPSADAGRDKHGEGGELLVFDARLSFDHEGKLTSYTWEFGDGTWDYGQRVTHTYDAAGTYTVTLRVFDDDRNVASDTLYVFIETYNSPPGAPLLSEIRKGSNEFEYEYTFVTSDINDDSVFLYIVWGDDYHESWIGPYNAGEKILVKHTYLSNETYKIRVKAKDFYGAEGDWITYEINTSKPTLTMNPLLLHFTTIFENCYRLFARLLNN